MKLAVMRAVVVLALAGCGRLGFGAEAAPDAARDASEQDAFAIANLVAHYGLDDDPTDGLLEDRTGHGFTATCVPGLTCPTKVDGKRGNAMQFDGETQLLRVADPGVFSSSRFTISAWVFIDDGSVDQVAVAKPYGTDVADSWAFVAWTTMTCLETTIAPESRDDACAAVTAPTGQWLHVAGTWNGDKKQLYVNGTVIAEQVNAAAVIFDSHDVLIGSDENSGSPAYQWHGRIDEVMFFDRALEPGEIAILASD